MAFEPRQTSVVTSVRAGVGRFWRGLELWLEEERERLPLWVPIALGAGIAAWFVLPNRLQWLGFCCAMLAVACGALVLPAGGRMRRAILSASLLACAGCLLVWAKAAIWGAPPLPRAAFVELTGEVRAIDRLPARQMSRVLVHPVDMPALPSLIRVNLDEALAPAGIGQGAVIRFRARLMPPAPPSLPGGHDFARRAYFDGIGATGRMLGPISVLRPATAEPPLRARLFAHILARVPGEGAGIAAALATGDQGAITEADAAAMRRSGLAHLLSISGLHVTALIAAAIFLLMRVMALNRRAALDWPLMLVAAGGGALAGIGYTLLTGAEVPTVRSCVAALLVLGGLAMGRDAITLRLVAAGALAVLLLWPEALVGPSFQMSFAAVVALVALGEHPRFRAFLSARDEGMGLRMARNLAGMLATGLAVELVLAPIALFHFHKAGVLGSVANLVAIPLTTLVVMPLEAAALLFDLCGWGAPFWWLTARALDLLLLVAHGVASSPWAVVLAPVQSGLAFGLILSGMLWCLLWRSRWRWAGLMTVTAGVTMILATPAPAILISGDGRHVAIRTAHGGMAMLRERAGRYMREAMTESLGHDGTPEAMAALPQARCSPDLCAVRLRGGGRNWNLLLTRSGMRIDPAILARDCARADIVVSDRRLPRVCRPRWLKADRAYLAATGGLAIDLDHGVIRSVKARNDEHPWMTRPVDRPRPFRAGQL
ncbi:ComEC/Rec2 family competence protein [Sphingobium chlorophenolicum]|uniref:ComEC/Rec2 family competence protein n=1 Tax=Sphingobium chlorophenolicum TaxID=46429 RepID=UPI001471B62C|nr:ComEC/Rec2 family competence protein [Sphingobium chlorophenolicum]